MYTPFSTDIDGFQACQSRHLHEIRSEIAQIRLAQSSQPPRKDSYFKLVLSLVILCFSR